MRKFSIYAYTKRVLKVRNQKRGLDEKNCPLMLGQTNDEKLSINLSLALEHLKEEYGNIVIMKEFYIILHFNKNFFRTK